MKIICTTCAHYCVSCGNCGIFHIGVTGMNVAPCRYYKPNDKPDMPKEFRTIIALVKFDDMPPMPLTGYMADVRTEAGTEPALFTYIPRGHAFAWEMVLKWDYIEPYSTTLYKAHGESEDKNKEAGLSPVCDFYGREGCHNCKGCDEQHEDESEVSE